MCDVMNLLQGINSGGRVHPGGELIGYTANTIYMGEVPSCELRLAWSNQAVLGWDSGGPLWSGLVQR